MNEKIRDVEFSEDSLITSSPLPSQVTKENTEVVMDFNKAVGSMMKGKNVTRKSWDDKDFYCLVKDSVLKIHKPDGKFYDWIISEGDLEGEDWITL